MEDYIQALLVSEPFHRPIIRSAVAELQLPAGSRGLDVGCGIGLQAMLMAEATGPQGHVTGVDQSGELLARATELAEKAGLSQRVDYRQGDAARLPFDDNIFDWAWSANCVGYAPLDPLAATGEMARVVRSGGIVALLAWSSQQLLPGYPQLEARLNATTQGIAPFRSGMQPQQHYLRAAGWMRQLGLSDVRTRTFIGEAQAPLGSQMRQALAALIDMRWPGAEAELCAEDAALFQRLCRADSPDYILDLPHYYAFFTETLFYGRVPS